MKRGKKRELLPALEGLGGKGWDPTLSFPFKLIPAATYSPTEFPLQYHGPWRT